MWLVAALVSTALACPPIAARPIPITMEPVIISTEIEPRPNLDAGSTYVGPAPKPVMIKLEGEVDDRTINPLIEKIKELYIKGHKQVWIYINSPGGYVSDGYNLINTLEALKFETFCIADQQAQSMAFYILQTCTHRYATKDTILMIHEPWIEIKHANVHDLSRLTVSLQVTTDKLIKTASTRVHLTETELRTKINDIDWKMSVTEAIEVGFLDSTYELTKTPKVERIHIEPPAKKNVCE